MKWGSEPGQYLGAECSKWWEQLVQRPRGRNNLGFSRNIKKSSNTGAEWGKMWSEVRFKRYLVARSHHNWDFSPQGRRLSLLSAWLYELGHPSSQGLSTPDSQAFRFGLQSSSEVSRTQTFELYHGLSGSPAGRWKIVGLLSSCHHESQFLMTNLILYIFIEVYIILIIITWHCDYIYAYRIWWFCFSGGPWLLWVASATFLHWQVTIFSSPIPAFGKQVTKSSSQWLSVLIVVRSGGPSEMLLVMFQEP